LINDDISRRRCEGTLQGQSDKRVTNVYVNVNDRMSETQS